MAKTIVGKKVIIEVNEAGEVANALLLYNINDNGNIIKNRSVSVIGGLSAETLNGIIAGAIASANTSEGI